MRLPKAIPIGFYPKITQSGMRLGEDSSVDEICSVSNHISSAPDDWIDHWLHKVVEELWDNGRPQSVRYEVDGALVARQLYDKKSALEVEYGVHNDMMHGPWRSYHASGQVAHETHYIEGKEHGVARQYDEDGTLIGSYEMVYGSGLDLWYHDKGVLAEERGYQDGERHGFERWWNEDNRTIHEESHFWRGLAHGIMRQWTAQGRLRRGYPQYFVQGEKVNKRQYLRACRTDSTLPLGARTMTGRSGRCRPA